MPKSVKKVKVGQEWHRVNVGTKFRIGNRKGGKSAHLMSMQELRDVTLDSNKKKWHHLAETVIQMKFRSATFNVQ